MVSTQGSVPTGYIDSGLMPVTLPLTVLLCTAAFAVPAVALGSVKVYRPLRREQRRRPMSVRDNVDRLVAMGVRVGILLVLIVFALVALVGSIAALVGEVSVPDGVVLAGIGAMVLSILTLTTFGRPRR
jgi:hypothetical protein